ncbi:MAG: sigma-54-dependent Fis family transcriptional regulator [Pseudomonadota bacterium]
MTAEHSRRIVSAVEHGADRGAEPAILASWRRCLEEHALQPDRIGPPDTLTGAELKDILTPIEQLVRIAEPEMERLHARLADSDYVVSLATSQGVTVSYRCDRKLSTEMRAYGLDPGTIWREESQGTNGIGTCARTGRALSVVADDHFGDFVKKLSCTVAPVFGAADRPDCVLNVTTPRRTDHDMQRIMRSIVSSSAMRIANAWFSARNRGRRIVRLTAHGDFLDAACEARLALDDEGRILEATDEAARLAGLEAAALPGARFADLFPRLPAPARPVDAAWVSAGRTGGRLLARLDGPAARETRRPRAAPRPVAQPPAPAVIDGVRLRLDSPVMEERLRRARRLIDSGLPILIQGETGTGKSLLARHLHRLGRRASKPFEALNCAAIPPTLIEAELFGYRPGAFTGASPQGARGRLLEADGGVLFLDEIGDMPPELQLRLLQVLSEGAFTPLGGGGPVKVDVAVISASHRDIAALVREGRFREDLFHRLNGARLETPPLRLRDDRGELIEAVFAEEAERLALPPARLTEPARACLETHLWPGNLRELRHAARHANALREGDGIGTEALPEDIAAHAPPGPDAERGRLQAALDRFDGNATQAARYLGVSRATFYRRLKAAGLRRDRSAR